jgi:hypothetical protein
MKILAALIVLVAMTLMSLMAYNWHQTRKSPAIVERWIACKPHEYLTGDGKCKAAEIPSPYKPPIAEPTSLKLFDDRISNTFAINEPCQKGQPHSFFTVNGTHGPIVAIDECNGHVTVYHPERMSKDALEFWRILQQTWPQVCAEKKPEKVCRIDTPDKIGEATAHGKVSDDATITRTPNGGLVIKGQNSQ